MSFTISTDVFCDGPCGGFWTEGTVGPENGRRESWKIAVARGWIKKDGKHLCPVCNGRAFGSGQYGMHWKEEFKGKYID